MIPLARPMIDPEAQAEVARVLSSGALVQGPVVERFESDLAMRTGRAHAVVVSHGTAALFLALRGLGVGPGDEVLCPALTWPSPAHAARALGASIGLVDVCPERWNSPAEAFRTARTKRTRVAIAIDQFGSPCDFEDIEGALPGIPVLRDAACALGATVAGKEAAGGGIIACLSFHPRKVLTTGEGGACLTDDDDLAAWLRRERNHGQDTPGRFAAPGLNYRLTDFAAAIGLHQLRRLDEGIARRREIARAYRTGLSLPSQGRGDQAQPNEQTFGIVVGESRDRWIAELKRRGVQSGILSYALSRLDSIGAKRDCTVAERLADEAIALPMFPELSDRDVTRVVEAVCSVQQTISEETP